MEPLIKDLDKVDKELKQTTRKVDKETTKISKSFKNIGKAIKGSAIIAGIAAIGAALVKLGKKAIGLASDFEETNQLVDLTFGDMRGQLDDLARSRTSSFGMTSQQLKEQAGLYMAMSEGMGIAKEAANQMSLQTTILSADLASLYNTTNEMAQTALTSIWTGETETMKKYGVVMTQANLDQFLLAKNINATMRELTQQEQVMVRYAYIMDALSLAQGNFNRESQGWSAQLKILQANINEILAILGQGLMQVILPVVRAINKILTGLIALARTASAAIKSIFGIKDTAQEAATPIQGISTDLGDIGGAGVDGMKDLGNAAKEAGKKAKGALAPFDELNVLTQPNAPGQDAGGGAGTGLGGLGAGIGLGDLGVGELKLPAIDTSEVDKMTEAVQTGINKIQDKWTNHKGWLKPLIAGLVGFIISAQLGIPAAIGISLSAIAAAIIELWQTDEGFRISVIDTWNKIKETIDTVINGIITEFQEFYNEYFKPITEGLEEAWTNFVMLVDDLWQNILKPIIDLFIRLIEDTWKGVLQPILSLVLTIIGEVITIVLYLWNKVISPFLAWLMEKLGPEIEHITQGIGDAWEWLMDKSAVVFGAIEEAVKLLGDALIEVIDFVVNIFTGDWEAAWEQIKNAFGGVWDWIEDKITTVWNTILDLFNAGGEIFEGITTGIWNVFKEAINWLIDGINAVIRTPLDFINGILNDIREFTILGGKPFGWIPYNAIPIPQVPYLETGTNIVPKDMLAFLHEGESVVPKKYNPAKAGRSDEELELLREQNTLLSRILDKDTSIYLDGDKLHENEQRKNRQLRERLGLA